MTGRPETMCPSSVQMFWDPWSPNQSSPGPLNQSSQKHNVPGLIHPRHFDHICVLYHAYSDRCVSIQGRCVSGTIDLVDQGSRKICTGTLRFGTSRHPTVFRTQSFYCPLYARLLHLPPLRFHWFGGCWDVFQGCCDI